MGSHSRDAPVGTRSSQVAGNSYGKYPHPHATDPRRGFMACKLVYMAVPARTLSLSLSLHSRPIKIPMTRARPFGAARRHVRTESYIRASVNFVELIRRLGASLIHESHRRISAKRWYISQINKMPQLNEGILFLF